MSVGEHKQIAPDARAIRVAIITVSDTRDENTDEGGGLIHHLSAEAGFTVVSRNILRDEPAQVGAAVQAIADKDTADVVLLTGGTGIARRDTTVEALAARFGKTLDGFGELFRMLSFQEIGPAAMLSRATAGVVAGTAVFLMPGSPAAVRLAMQRLILPELPHIVAQLRQPDRPADAGPTTRSEDPSRHHHEHRPHRPRLG